MATPDEIAALLPPLPEIAKDREGYLLPELKKPDTRMGRPRTGRQLGSLTAELHRQLDEACPIPAPDGTQQTWREFLVQRTLQLAAKGNPVALKEVFERIDGKVAQPLTIGGDEPESQVELNIRIVDGKEDL